MKDFIERFDNFYWTGESHFPQNEMPIVKRELDLLIADYLEEIFVLQDFLYRENPPYHSGLAVKIGADIEHLYDLIYLSRIRKKQLWKFK